MRVLGLTRSGKAVNDNKDLDVEELFKIYSDFSYDDHYDAACIWVVNTPLDYEDYFRNKEFHLVNIGKSCIDTIDKTEIMAAHGRALIRRVKDYDWMQTAK